MKKFTLVALLGALITLTACEKGLEEKKAELAEMKEELKTLENDIKELEQEIAELDPTFNQKKVNYTLVSTLPVASKAFEHKIEVRGGVESRRNIMVSSETAGRVLRLHVKEGDFVQGGSALVDVDAQTIKDNIAELETSLDLANAVFERQANLWKRKIGTEIQYLQAKNNKESLERRLKTARTQLSYAYVKAPFSGTIEQVNIKEGEMVQPGLPLLRVVSLKNMYITASVSERQVGNFKKGDVVDVTFPSLDRKMKSTISAVGQVIDNLNRTFEIEVSLPADEAAVRPNMTAILLLTDYATDAAMVVPTNLIQADNKGQFLYKVEKGEEGEMATKAHIKIGKSYEGETEVLGGLSGQETIIDKGFRDVSEGALVKITANTLTANK